MFKKITSFAIALGLMLFIAACGKSAEEGTANTLNPEVIKNEPVTAASSEIKETEDAGFPLTIKHAFGETVIEKKPERIATIGWENDSTPLVLGIAPVGVSASNYGAASEYNLHLWAQDEFDKLGVTPNVFDDVDGLDFEAIADANPDVILAAYSGITEDDYNTLSQIAPVVAYPNKPWQTSWREQTLFNAKGLGLEKEAQEAVEKTEKLIADKVAERPEFKDIDAAFCWLNADDFSTFYVYLPTDPRAAYLTDLGFPFPDSVLALAEDAEAFSVTMSRENADKLADLQLIVCYGTPDMLPALQEDEIMSTIPAIRDGAVVFIDPSSALAGGATPSILSIPYNIDTYLDLLSEAAAKIVR